MASDGHRLALILLMVQDVMLLPQEIGASHRRAHTEVPGDLQGAGTLSNLC